MINVSRANLYAFNTEKSSPPPLHLVPKRMKLDLLPQDCTSLIFSLTSPRDACRAGIVSIALRSALDSDATWEWFLPSDYREILSRLDSFMTVSSKKELFLKLCDTLLIDGGRKSFSLEKSTGKKCCMLSARELSIAWGSFPLYWSWKPHSQSRFDEVAELRTIWWLEILGMIDSRMLSPETKYGAYLVVQFADRSYGLDTLPSQVSLEVGNHKSKGTVYLRPYYHKNQSPEETDLSSQIKLSRSRGFEEERVVRDRGDGWEEIELGEFYNGEGEEEVKMSLREVKGPHLRGGLIVEGIELRPKQ